MNVNGILDQRFRTTSLKDIRRPLFLAIFLSSISLASCRNGHLPHNVKCVGWNKICANLKGDVVGPARVGSQVVIDCLDSFNKPEADYEKVEWIVEEWKLPRNDTNHFIDDQRRLHLVNVTESGSGNYSCHVAARTKSRIGSNPSFLHSLQLEAVNRTASISWPLVIYAPASDSFELVLIWSANAVLAVLFFFLLFVNERGLKRNPAIPPANDQSGGRDNRVSPVQAERRPSTKYGTLEAVE